MKEDAGSLAGRVRLACCLVQSIWLRRAMTEMRNDYVLSLLCHHRRENKNLDRFEVQLRHAGHSLLQSND